MSQKGFSSLANCPHVLEPYPGKCLDLVDVLAQHGRLISFMKPIKFRDIVHLDVVFEPVAETVKH